MKVTRRAIDDYRKAVDEQADLAKAYVDRALESYFAQNPGASTADGRMFAIDLLKTALPNFTDAAETLAADFFDEVMEGLGIDAESKLYDPIDYDTVEERVHYFAKKLNEGDEKAFMDQVVDATRYFVKRSAYENMVRNCEGNNVRYARVPSGFESCPFCFMLASRGFVYHSEAKAWGAHGYHDNCDCTVVPGVVDKNGKPRVRIEGYDPETMHRNWSSCEDTVGGHKQARAEWLALTEEERATYIDRHGNAAKAFARFEQNRIKNEVAARDWHWLYTGEPAKVDYASADVERRVLVKYPNEKKTADKLAKLGIRCRFMQDYIWEKGEDGIKRKVGLPDFENGVEIKTPIKSQNPYGAVDNYLENCVKKKGLKRIIIDNTESLFSDADLSDAIDTVMENYPFERVTYLGKDLELHDVYKR